MSADAPDKIVIEIDLNDLPVGTGEEGWGFRDYIARLAAGRIVERGGDLYESLAERVKAITDDEIRAGIRPLLEEALAQPFVKTDAFGTAKGEPTTLREMIVVEARAWLTKERGSGFDGWETPLRRFLREEVERALKKDLEADMQEAREQVRAAVREQGAQVLAETIRRMAPAGGL